MRSILRVFDKTGKRVDIPAIRGEAGYSPVAGVDYYTEEEKAELVHEVFTMLPAWEMVATFDDGSTATYQLYGKAVE